MLSLILDLLALGSVYNFDRLACLNFVLVSRLVCQRCKNCCSRRWASHVSSLAIDDISFLANSPTYNAIRVSLLIEQFAYGASSMIDYSSQEDVCNAMGHLRHSGLHASYTTCRPHLANKLNG